MKLPHLFRHNARAARLGALAVMFALAAAIAAPVQAQSRPQKIGVVDVDRIMAQSVSFQSAARRIESSLQPLKEKLTGKMQERNQLEQSIRERSTVLKADEVAQLKERYIALDTDVRDSNYTITKESDRLQREILEPVMKRLKNVIEETARSQGYDLVLYANQLFYFSDSVDLTPMVLQSLDRGAGAEAAKPALPTTDNVSKASSRGDDEEKAASSKKTSRGLLRRRSKE